MLRALLELHPVVPMPEPMGPAHPEPPPFGLRGLSWYVTLLAVVLGGWMGWRLCFALNSLCLPCQGCDLPSMMAAAPHVFGVDLKFTLLSATEEHKEGLQNPRWGQLSSGPACRPSSQVAYNRLWTLRSHGHQMSDLRLRSPA